MANAPWDARNGVPASHRAGGAIELAPAQSVYEASTTKNHPLGTVTRAFGNWAVYCKASESLSKGKLVTAIPVLSTEDTVTVAHPIGTTAVTHTASVEISANQFEDGFLVVDEGTAAGDSYPIKSHAAIASAAAGTINLYVGLLTAWAIADSDITLYTSPYNVQESNTDQVEFPIGAPLIDVASGSYFWCICAAPPSFGPVLFDEACGNASGTRVLTIGSSTAGTVEAVDATAEAAIAQAILNAADYEDAKYGLVAWK